MKVRSSVTFNEEFNGDLGFDLGSLLQGHFKVNFFFSNENLYFWHRQSKERKILRSGVY